MIGDMDTACKWFGDGLTFDLDPTLAYVQAMVISYGHALLQTGQAEKALQFINIYDNFSSSADFVYLMGLIYKENKYYAQAIHEFKKALGFEFANQDGVNSFLAYYQLGEILASIGETESAIKFFKMCGEYSQSKQLLASLSQSAP